MLFNSLAFAVFLPIVFIAYWAVPHKFRWPILLVSSYYFYMSWNPEYVVLIFLTTAVSYGAALGIERAPKAKKWILLLALGICLGVLFVFKYFNFFSASVTGLLSLLAIPMHPVTVSLLLPVGISFYTFQTLSYVIDVYRGEIPAERNFGVYAAFVSFFPQLVAGPIERTGNLLPQITSRKTFDYQKASYGLKLMAWGFFKKLAVADVLGKYVDAAYGSLELCTGFDLFAAIFFFTIQIYCDFSGYSDIAIGTAKLLGIDLMTNFKSPYFSLSIKEFWSRWHISLSTWFRDYVYIPLGGNRRGSRKRDRNLVITFLVSGLWHGANWTYVVWGGIHGIAQVVENHCFPLKKGTPKGWRFLRWLGVFVFCNIAWVFFRAESLKDAWYVLTQAALSLTRPGSFFPGVTGLEMNDLCFILFSIGLVAGFDFLSLKQDVIALVSRQRAPIRWACYLALVWLTLCLMLPAGTSEFVYFQF